MEGLKFLPPNDIVKENFQLDGLKVSYKIQTDTLSEERPRALPNMKI
jgi:hypothetical protein